MKRFEPFVVLLLIVGAVLGGSLFVRDAVDVFAQVERPSLPKQWQAGYLPEAAEGWINQATVDVIETSGACIYVLRTEQADSGDKVRMHILPKAQLGAGRGC